MEGRRRGVQHWSDARQRSWDIERIALLEASGWTVIRVSAEMLRRPQAIIRRVVTELRAAGCPIYAADRGCYGEIVTG